MITSVSSVTFPTLQSEWMILLSSSSSRSRVGLPGNIKFPKNLSDIDLGWKRLLLADGPRQSINALTLYGFYLSKQDKGEWYDLGKYFDRNDLVTSALTASTAFIVLIFAGSLLLLITAGVCYIPLLCHIRGNLKEYCCHKVDKVSYILLSPLHVERILNWSAIK